MKEKGITKFSSLFRQIFQNLLFLLQLAIIKSDVKQPFVNLPRFSACRRDWRHGIYRAAWFLSHQNL
jgi:hypothetical protein